MGDMRNMSDRRVSYLSARTTSKESDGNPSRIPGGDGKGGGSGFQNYQSSDDRWHQWIATNLPEEVGNAYVMSAVMQFWCRNPRHKRTEPNPDDVRELLRSEGHDNASLRRDV